MVSTSLLNFSFFMCIVFLISLNYLSVFSYSSLSSLKLAILNSLSGQLQISVFGVHDQKITVFFSWYQVSLVFHVPENLALLFWYLKQQLPPPVFIDWLWERNAFYQPARHSEVFPDLQWICLLHTCTFCDRILKFVTLQHTRPGANRLPPAFLWSVLKLVFVVSPSPANLGWLTAHAQIIICQSWEPTQGATTSGGEYVSEVSRVPRGTVGQLGGSMGNVLGTF